ncbi:MAG: DUF4982 domain-containing protein [Clostridium sp.]|nr:DUF4982 domain-containing protein [Clostridium sp.]
MKKTNFNEGWKYWLDNDSFALVWDVPEKAREITLPHDAMLESKAHAASRNGGNTGYRDGGVYQYVKEFCPDAEDTGKTFILKFEGIYMNAMVYVNGDLAGKCPYGYTGFYVPLNNFLRFGEKNEIRVIVRNSGMTNSRWYSGGGIYRDVYLLTAEQAYLEPEGTKVVTEVLEEERAVLRISSKVKNRASHCRNLTLQWEIWDENGTSNKNIIGREKAPFVILEGESCEISARIVVRNPQPWSAETPQLYRIHTSLWEEGEKIEEEEVSFGIRTLQLDAEKGLRVNGKEVKLRGACIHHDSGILGAATFYDAEYRRVKLLKEAGFNAIRMSHHPAAPALLRACDELGMYVMDETFDMWNRCKSDNDYGLFFSEWWEKDTEAMVQKDFNHPSVILYSVGNEIPEIGSRHGSKWCRRIAQKIKSLDNTRFTLASINGVFAAGEAVPQIMGDIAAELESEGAPEGNVNDFMTIMDTHMDKIVTHPAISKRLELACAGTDIAGYNYMTARYEPDGKNYPNRVIVGSETYPPEIARNWVLVEKLPYLIGDFTWTGWDYIGEAGVGIPGYVRGEGGFGAVFPSQLAYCGDIDITGFRRPASYFREIVFGLRKEPYLAVQRPEKYGQKLIKTPWVISDALNSWTYPGQEQKPVVVEVYSAGDETELLLNGKSLGRKQAGKEAGYRVLFETVYAPGVLEAVSYENGKELGRTKLCTGAENVTPQLYVEEMAAGELSYVHVKVADTQGISVYGKEYHVKAEAKDVMQLWIGSGNPKPEYNYFDGETDTWNGNALIVVRKRTAGEKIALKVWVDNKEEEIYL